MDIPKFSQKTIQQTLDNDKFQSLKANLASERKSARILSLSVRQAGAWLSAPPNPAPGLHMVPNEIRVRAKYRLGVPVYNTGRKWALSEAGVLDIYGVYGDHAIVCHSRGEAIAKHDRIRKKLCLLAHLRISHQ